MTTLSRRRLLTGAVALGGLALAGCAGPSASPTPAASGGASALAATPNRIVALSSELSDLALQLVGPDRLAAIAEGSLSPHLGTQVELARAVETTFAGGTNPEPERVLALQPDLVLLTSRHAGEQGAEKVLKDAGVTVLAFPDSAFASPEALADTITQLGEALGAGEKAAGLVATLTSELTAVDATVPASPQPVSVLTLMNRGGKVFLTGSNTMVNALVARAKGTSANAALGLKQAVPAEAETILKANPDLIVLEDFMGSGAGPYQALLSSPALAQVPAIAGKRQLVLPMVDASSVSGTRTPVGYATLVKALHGAA